jgi:2,3-bisphosphoglycerate-independent phosphoglycerate mutase
MTKKHTPPYRPTILCILDGWGHRHSPEHNAIALANTPVWDHFMKDCPHSLIEASALDVGLPEGQMGNSEVGHMNIGAGRVVMQDLPRIDAAIADGSLARNPRLQSFISALQQSGGDCHLMGLFSDGGVHSHLNHMMALAKIISEAGVKVWIHAFTDGRDTPPRSIKEYLSHWERSANSCEQGEGSPHPHRSRSATSPTGRGDILFATISGRYYAMDRDNRWERVQLAFDAMVHGKGAVAADAVSAIEQSYQSGKNDEFILPTVISDYKGMKKGDGLLMANFRADRAHQMLHALLDEEFHHFERGNRVNGLSGQRVIGMTEYSSTLATQIDALFPPQSLANGLGEVLSNAGLTQLRIAETEKYAHVTFFFNGGVEAEYKGESRILIPSPKVATYDLKPEMSAFEVTAAIENAIAKEQFDVIIVNYANGDMVGHSGDLQAAIKAVEAVDACLGRLEKAITATGGVMLITADHGNAEQMFDPETGQPHTAHTTLPVPLILVGKNDARLQNGRLADIAPTLLTLLNLPQPAEMTGKSLIE